ncbi:hypothetical protein CHUAL_004188 [Chamberlinius hualienensis]
MFRGSMRGRRFSPNRNRRSLSRGRSTSPRRPRNDDRSNRHHERSRKSMERRLSPPGNRQRSPMTQRQRSWDRNQSSGGGGSGVTHHDEIYQEMRMTGGEMRDRSRGFSPNRSHPTSDIDERMHGRSSSPIRSERFMESGDRAEMRNYSGEAMVNEIQSFQSVNYNSDTMLRNTDTGLNVTVTDQKPQFTSSYTQEELKKITVDIYRNISATEPVNVNKRLIVNPEDVVVVRRSGEGSRPIFDRDDIKQAQHVRDITFERRVVALVSDGLANSSHTNNSSANEFPGSGERENFQINSDHFNSGYSNSNTTTRQSLNDRWQKLPSADNMTVNLERNRDIGGGGGMKIQRETSSSRDIPYLNHPQHHHHGHPDDVHNHQSGRSQSRSHSPIYRRSENSRFSSTGRRSSLTDEHRRNRRTFEDDSRSFRSNRGRQSNDNHDDADKFRRRQQRDYFQSLNVDSHNELSNAEQDKNFEDDRDLPNFSNRPDKYRYQEWLEKPDVVPKGPSYFEHDNRGERRDRDARGRGRGGRGEVRSRGRGFRGGGTFRSIRGGGTFRSNRGIGSSSGGGGGGLGGGGERGRFAPRGRRDNRSDMISPKNQRSPNHWQHDMFEKSPDQNSVQDNNPSSTTGSK